MTTTKTAPTVKMHRPAPGHKTARTGRGERGGFLVGLIVGLLIGLALALGVALYVTKVPVPFINKVPQRSPDQDAAEAAHNKNWDPNAPLVGKVIKPILNAPAASDATPDNGMPNVVPPTAATTPAPAPVNPAPRAADAGLPKSARDPGAILSGQSVSPAAAPMIPPRSRTDASAFTYFVQAGAFSHEEDAEQLRAKLALSGLLAKVTEREQSGRTVYRVRLGPFDRKEDADSAQERLQASNGEAALVRVENTTN